MSGLLPPYTHKPMDPATRIRPLATSLKEARRFFISHPPVDLRGSNSRGGRRDLRALGPTVARGSRGGGAIALPCALLCVRRRCAYGPRRSRVRKETSARRVGGTDGREPDG